MQDDRRAPFALVVEDHPLVADSLVAFVRDCAPGLDIEVAESLAAALRILAQRTVPLLIITDLTLPDTQGAHSVRQLHAAAPASPLLVFTALDNPRLREEVMREGACGYFVKNTHAQVLREEIRLALGKLPPEKRATPEIKNKAAGLLTPKQIDVLNELSTGRSNKEIAVRLNISDETVGSHMKDILGRLGAKNRTEAVVRYLQLINQPQDQRRRADK